MKKMNKKLLNNQEQNNSKYESNLGNIIKLYKYKQAKK